MTRFYALVFAAISCACGSLSATAPSDAPSLVSESSPKPQPENLPPDSKVPRSTVPMTADGQKDDASETMPRTTHVFWFFGSR